MTSDTVETKRLPYLDVRSKVRDNQETKRPRDQETKRPRDQETKRPRDQETKRPRDQETKRPREQETKRPKVPTHERTPYFVHSYPILELAWSSCCVPLPPTPLIKMVLAEKLEPWELKTYPMDPAIQEAFDKDIRDLHLLYDYDAHDAEGNPEKWRYEMWFFSHNRIVYAIHGGPMKGRLNYQTVTYQCIRPGELWQCNWLEETGTIVSLVYDIPKQRITTCLGFSKGHWECAEEAHGDKRNPEDFQRWRGLAKMGIQTDRHMLSEQANILETFRGAGNLLPIEENWPTI